jgi:flagellar assembly protein FliH
MMTISSDFFAGADGATTTLPGPVDMDAVLPELTTPQERYDHGYQRGYTAGYAEGVRQAHAELAADLANHKAAWASDEARASALLARLATATEHYVDVYGPREAELTDAAVRTAFQLAEAVVGRELSLRPDRAIEMARQVLRTLPTGPAIVRANPDDMSLLEAAGPTLGNGAQQVTLVADPAVGAGGCIVSSGATSVDARLSVALEAARQAFCEGTEEPGGPGPASSGAGGHRHGAALPAGARA